VNDLYDRHAAPLIALACRILGDRADAEDVALEALATVWRAPDRFEPGRGSLRAWLTVMVRNSALDLVRVRARRGELMAHAAADHNPPGLGAEEPDPATVAEADEQRRHVLAALRELPEAQRQAIELAFYEGLTQSEIADRVGAPLGTVKTRIRDGMNKLRTALRPLYLESPS
jgi:RNA polymerase sigma-70 factor (ECF subfamily)